MANAKLKLKLERTLAQLVQGLIYRSDQIAGQLVLNEVIDEAWDEALREVKIRRITANRERVAVSDEPIELAVAVTHWRDAKGDNEKSLCNAEERAQFTGEAVVTVPYPESSATCDRCREIALLPGSLS